MSDGVPIAGVGVPAQNATVVDRQRDHYGRLEIDQMSDRELLEEIAVGLRTFGDALGALSESPMIRAMGITNPFGQ